MAMTHRQRIEAALAFQQADRIPYSMWMHFPNRDRNPRRLAELSLELQRRYDLDFIKFMPFGLYTTVDYGIDLDVFPGFNTPPVAHKPLVEKVGDWDGIRFMSGTEGEYAIVLEAQRILFLRAFYGSDIWFAALDFEQSLADPRERRVFAQLGARLEKAW